MKLKSFKFFSSNEINEGNDINRIQIIRYSPITYSIITFEPIRMVTYLNFIGEEICEIITQHHELWDIVISYEYVHENEIRENNNDTV